MDCSVSRIVSLVLIATLPLSAVAERADDAKMASEALAPFISSRADAGERQARVESIHADVRVRGRQNPNDDVSATIVFGHGYSIGELSKMANRYGLEIVTIHLKTPYNDRGAVQSIDIGSADLARYRGGFESRAEKAVGAIRYQFLQWAKNLPPDDAEAHLQMAKQDMLIYRCEAYGKSERIAAMLDEQNVAVVIPDDPDRGSAKMADHKNMRDRVERAWEARDRIQNR